MTQPLEHIEYLSKEIGARPAGTEEEQNAALYIADQFKKEAGYHAEIEEFTGTSNFTFVRAICCGVIILVTILAMVAPVLAIPAFVLSLIAAAIYILEALDKPFITRALARSASQNVVAKYQPFQDDSAAKGGRTRKIVLVARYDSGKATPALVSRVESINAPLGLICAGATALATLLLLIRIFLGSGGGPGIAVLNVLSIVALLVVALPLVKSIMIQLAPYNEGANNNASGVAAILEVARRISRGSVSEADLVDESEGIAIHGEAAAIANGLVPEGAEIRYEAERLTPPEMEPLDDEERLLSAKAAIAALTGQPVERKTYGSVASHLVNTRTSSGLSFDTAAAADDGANQAQGDSMAPASPAQDASASQMSDTTWTNQESTGPAVIDGFDNAPSWFVAAQQKAKRPSGLTGPIQRSRYTDAIEAAEREAAERERMRQEEELARREEERRMREEAMRASLSEMEQRRSFEVQDEVSPVATADYVEEYVTEDTSYAYDKYEAAPAPYEVEPMPAVVDVEPEPEVEIAPEPEVIEQPAPDATVAVAPINMKELAKELDQELAEEVPGAQEEELLEEEVVPAVRRRITALPEIDERKTEPEETKSPSRSGLFRKLRSDIPSKSGILRMPDEIQEEPKKQAKHLDPASIPSLSMPIAANDGVDYDMEVPYGEEDFTDDANGRNGWNGGALSRIRLGHVDTRSGEESTADEPEEIEIVEEVEDATIADEIEKIYHFRNPLFNTEIWFVAIGCNTDYHDGAVAFINEHQSELRGAMVIEVESLGLGELSVASEEGRFLKVNASSRIKRFTRAAQAATGLSLSNVSLAGDDSIASVVQKAGFQSMHLFGAEDGRIALKGSADDVLENIDEDVLDDNVNFLMELLKHN